MREFSELAEIHQQLPELRLRHRELDDAIEEATREVTHGQLAITRMKKERLRLKDLIARLESALIPDQPA